MSRKKSKSPVITGTALGRVEAVARLSLERKKAITEIIPPDVTREKSRAWLDLLSPFTEWAGLRGDQLKHKRELLRIQQETVLSEIVRKAIEQLSDNHAVVSPLPTKFLVPFLERASTEDPVSELMDWWASLLASAATGKGRHPIFVEMIARITGDEAKFLEGLWRLIDVRTIKHTFADVLEIVSNQSVQRVEETSNYYNLGGEEYDLCMRDISEQMTQAVQRYGIFCRYFRFPTHSGKSGSLRIPETDMRLFDICVTAGILKRTIVVFPIPTPFIGEYNVSGEFFVFSELGLEFMMACHKQAAQGVDS
jgi:hypothetical protein